MWPRHGPYRTRPSDPGPLEDTPDVPLSVGGGDSEGEISAYRLRSSCRFAPRVEPLRGQGFGKFSLYFSRGCVDLFKVPEPNYHPRFGIVSAPPVLLAGRGGEGEGMGSLGSGRGVPEQEARPSHFRVAPVVQSLRGPLTAEDHRVRAPELWVLPFFYLFQAIRERPA